MKDLRKLALEKRKDQALTIRRSQTRRTMLITDLAAFKSLEKLSRLIKLKGLHSLSIDHALKSNYPF